ncbi:hypothetical protein P7C71_g5335, partial [Lecanoromycetidae sp. Uapishka_2]
MDEQQPLQGACSCGRNHYHISIPSNPVETFRVLYDDRTEHSRALSLRVPLTHIRSVTYAFYPDETASTIRKVFSPNHAPHTKRHFCGLCGTQLSHWSEETPKEAEMIYINLGSLKSESVERLEEAGLLSTTTLDDDSPSQPAEKDSTSMANTGPGREIRGTPWFEQLIDGSELGRIRRTRGGETSLDGKTKTEWEVTEFESGSGEDDGMGTGKRKHDSLAEDDDVHMKSG